MVRQPAMATHLCAHGVDPWELEGQLGQKKLDVTETYPVFAPDYSGTGPKLTR